MFSRHTSWLSTVSPVVMLFLLCPESSAADWFGSITAETRAFFQQPAYSGQHGEDLSLKLEAEYSHEWNELGQQLVFKPFFRLDQHDPERSHTDIRELYWVKSAENWELTAGINKVYWGVAESQHLVDIINQTDLVEDIDGKEKLGQPMVNLAWIHTWGVLDFYILPGFRERTFPGESGRFRPPLEVDTNDATFESGAEANHVDWAVRWSHSLGAWDIGLSHFSGTSREPRLRLNWELPADFSIVPHYEQIDQSALDAQYTRGGWLLKLEAIYRRDQREGFFASTCGFEYTFSGVGESGVDVGILAEYLYDDRGKTRQSPFENDVFVGARIQFSDVQSTQMLLGGIVDLDTGATLLSLEASRRIGNDWKLSIETRAFVGYPENDIGYWIRRDDYLQAQLTWYF